MNELIKKLEAILFSAGDRISIDELSRITKEKDIDSIKSALRELRDLYNRENRPFIIQEEGSFWKMNTRDEHQQIVRRVVKKLELPKTLLETLAVVAWKAPVLQSKIIHARTNKAYDHLDKLEEMGYITRKKYGRTKLIKLTQKFYEYFDINKRGGLKRIFRRVTERAKKKFGTLDIDEGQSRLEVVDEQIAEAKKKLSTYNDGETGEKLGDLHVYDEKPKLKVVDEESEDAEEMVEEEDAKKE